ncbi:Fructokinase [uncultured spirochete]|uniref:Fructokinase n=1 Tax=uncultured spirochete TaxID=156406 RepID=A0A3P3XSS1_9SPIR|nr:Fructokinase [uncultured spirochete]
MIAACGESLIDMVPSEQGRDLFEACPGGCPYTSAIAAARLTVPTWFVGKTSKDFLGDKIVSKLQDSGVDTSLLIRNDQAVTLAFVERDAAGNANYAFYSADAADRFLSPSDLPAKLPEQVVFLLVGSISLVQEPSCSTILSLIEREHGRKLISFDPNVRPSLIQSKSEYRARFEWICQRSAIVKASDSDLEWLYECPANEAANKVLGLGPELVALTMGEHGSLFLTRRYRIEFPAKQVKVVDTIGAGDSFHAGLLAGLGWLKVRDRDSLASLSENNLRTVLRLATSAAALDCTKRGAGPPTLHELAVFDPEAVRVAPGFIPTFNTKERIC